MRNVFVYSPQTGLNLDIAPDLLPAGAFSRARNYLPKGMGAGMAPALDAVDIPVPNEGNFLFTYMALGKEPAWFSAGTDSIYELKAASSNNVTRDSGPYSAGDNSWSGVDFNGVAVLNNPADVPQYFDTSTGKFKDVPNFPVGTRFNSVAKFKNYLFGLGVTNSGQEYSSEVFWSAPASPGGVPDSWDVTLGGQAGTQQLPSRGYLLAGLELRNQLILYKTDSIWGARFSGGQFTFSFDKLFDNVGLLAPNLVAQVEGKHVLVTMDDVILHDGQRITSIGTDRIKKDLFNNLDKTRNEAFMLADYPRKHLWICIPTWDKKGCDRAYIWDWEKNTWGVKDLPYVTFGALGLPAQPAAPWDNEIVTWDGKTGGWDDIKEGTEFLPSPYFRSTDVDKLFTTNKIGREQGSNMSCFIERVALPLGPLTRDGVIIPDYRKVKIVSQIFLDIICERPVVVEWGYQDDLGTPLIRDGAISFDPSNMDHIDTFVTGRFLWIRVTGFHPSFEFRRMAIEFEMGGEF